MTISEAGSALEFIKDAYPSSFRGITREEAIKSAKEWSLHFEDVPLKYVMTAIKNLIKSHKFPPTVADVKEELVGMVWDAREKLCWHKHNSCPVSEEVVKESQEIEEVLGHISPLVR